MMTPRENAMAIFERRQPDYYGDLMHAVAFIPDPISAMSSCPKDGKEHADPWGTVYIHP
jgi:hypothetical protein